MHIAVEPGAGLARELDDRGPERHVGHEMRIHDVDVERVGARAFRELDAAAQVAEVGPEERRQDLDFAVHLVPFQKAAVALAGKFAALAGDGAIDHYKLDAGGEPVGVEVGGGGFEIT